MKYSYLKKWTSEQERTYKIVDKAYFVNHELQVFFTDGTKLQFCHLENEFFPLISSAKSNAKTSGIWKNIENARWIKTSILDQDRIIYFDFEHKDIYQEVQYYRIIAECILPQPNVILCRLQKEQAQIIDAIKKYSYADNPQRQVLSNLPYFPPLTTYKPQVEEICYPLLVCEESGIPTQANSMNEYLHLYYNKVLLPREEMQKTAILKSKYEKEQAKLMRKLAKQLTEYQDSQQADKWQVMAETIKHHLYSVNKGDLELVATNYYDPDMASIRIPLFADKSPNDNMKYYLHKYRKAKNGLQIIAQNIEQTKEAIALFDDILDRLQRGEIIDLAMLKDDKQGSLKGKLSKIDKLLKLRIDEDWEIVIGRKASENDLVTTQVGRPHDWWFHTRIYHGSHILLRNFRKQAPPDMLIEICCALAAWYSKAKFSENVPVDYTQIRYVRKPRKSPAGYVIYTTHQTQFCTPKDIRQIKSEYGI